MAKTQLLLSRVDELASYFHQLENVNESVSKAPVGWHVGHSFKVINSVFRSLEISEVENYRWKFSFNKFWFCFVTKKFPRGKARSPKSLLPGNHIVLNELEEQLELAKKYIQDSDGIPFNANVKHPYFGQLSKKESLAFLQIHTEHHLKIIRDILKENQ